MNEKYKRHEAIKKLMLRENKELTTTELFEKLKALNFLITRKTVERDLLELIEEKVVRQTEGIPIKFFLVKEMEIFIKFNREEVDELLKYIPSDSLIRRKFE
jgi:arginine repressor